MAFQIFHPYINIDETLTREPQHSEEETEEKALNLSEITENIKHSYNNLPKEGNKFRSVAVEELVYGILERELRGTAYGPHACRKTAKELSQLVRDEVKSLGLERYKIVCIVSIGSVCGQGLNIASRCLWFPVTDASASVVYKNSSLFAVATVFGLYVE